MTQEQTIEIVKITKAHVDANHNCRVGWAASEILNRPASPAELDKLAAEIDEDPKYRKERKGYNDWNIVKRPEKQMPSRWDFWSKRVAIIEAILIIFCTPIGLYLQNSSDKLEQENKQLIDTVRVQSHRIKYLEDQLKKERNE